MTGIDNPYKTGGQMTATLQHGSDSPDRAATPLIKDTTTAGFTKDVLEESRIQPVLVDFWAPWCGPCKQLTPIIEKVVSQAHGRVKLVKMNIDDHPSIAGQLGIKSIPAVIAFVNGRPMDGFMGALPETEIHQFIDKIAGPEGADRTAEIQAVLVEADGLLVGGDAVGAGDLYTAILELEPENLSAISGIARIMIAAGQPERAHALLAPLTAEQRLDKAIALVIKKLDQIDEARKLGDPIALERELALNPDHHASRMKLAKILNVEGDREAAAEHLLFIMKRDRAFENDGARRQLVEFFEVWGPKDLVTIQSRRKLSSILFS